MNASAIIGEKNLLNDQSDNYWFVYNEVLRFILYLSRLNTDHIKR